jgi:hypothetical protein
MATLVACTPTSPISYLANTPTPQDATYTCALRKVNELGYTVVNTDRQAGFINATKQTSGMAMAVLANAKYNDVLTVSIYDATDGDARTLRVTAGQTQERAMGFGAGAGSATGVAPSQSGIADAKSVLATCAPDSDVVEQPRTASAATLDARLAD